MKIVMNKTTPGSSDGMHVKQYREGETHDLPVSLANVFLKMGVAKLYVEQKMESKAPENKVIEVAPANKSFSKFDGRKKVVSKGKKK